MADNSISLAVSTTHALSAAHCRLNRVISQLGLLVGEHDTTRGNETKFTVLHRIASYISHPAFSSNTNANDIALIRTQNVMTFSEGVQPACLPFKFRGVSLVNQTVQGLGW
jgi:Trypsin